MSTPFSSLSWRAWSQGTVLAGALLLAVGSARAGERTLRIEAPAAVAPGGMWVAAVSASAAAGSKETISFLQAEASVDGGKTWTALCYLDNVGSSVAQSVSVKAGPLGSEVRLRVRAAYRGGPKGDVDYTGVPISWGSTWNDWMEPPARHAVTPVKAK